MQLIDLSQTIEPGMQLFRPKAPKPVIKPWMSHEQSKASGIYQDCTCEISEAHFVTSLGTYLDSPYHFDPDGISIEQLDLSQLVLPGVVVDCTSVSESQPIGPAFWEDVEVSGKAVLFHTGWSRFWGQPEYYQHPYLNAETANALLAGGAKLVGVDFLVIDDTRNPRRPVHVTLLKNDILIVENLTNLESLPASGFTFHTAPIKFTGAAAFPVRAYAVLEG